MMVTVKMVNERADSDVALKVKDSRVILNRWEAECLHADLEELLDYK